MAKRVKIKVAPSVSTANLLTVEEAMQQILDYFSLLEGADESLDDSNERVVWKLVEASTNSPFTVVAEAYGDNPAVNFDARATKVLHTFKKGMEDVVMSDSIPQWMEKKTYKDALQNVLKRNINGIGRTDIDLGEDVTPVIISHKTADHGLKNIAFSQLKKKKNDYTHTAYGTIEGQILSVTTYYSKPCFSIRERLTHRDTRCIVQPSLADKIGEKHNLNEVWSNKRVIVEGSISYDADGNIVNIDAIDIKIVEAKNIPVQDFLDPNFTNGLPVSEYLDKVREGKDD